MSTQGFHGSCACGRISFKTNEDARNIVYCYCTQCAKVSGSGYLPFAHVSSASVEWLQKPDVWKSSALAERGFCASCGSALFMRYHEDKDEIGLVLSAIDGDVASLSPPSRHIFLKEKASWVIVPDDGADRFEMHETAFQQQFDGWKKVAA